MLKKQITASIKKAANKTSGSGFAKGGAVVVAKPVKTPKLKTGGAVEGKAAAPRLDKFARGGRTGSPYSSGHSQSGRNNGGAASGKERTPC